jgi:hypothetical protein
MAAKTIWAKTPWAMASSTFFSVTRVPPMMPWMRMEKPMA